MPIPDFDAPVASKLAREAEKFAAHVRAIPRDKAAPRHPEIGQVLRSFQKINEAIAKGNKGGAVTLRHKVTMGREFQKMGAALRSRPTPKR